MIYFIVFVQPTLTENKSINIFVVGDAECGKSNFLMAAKSAFSPSPNSEADISLQINDNKLHVQLNTISGKQIAA